MISSLVIENAFQLYYYKIIKLSSCIFILNLPGIYFSEVYVQLFHSISSQV